MRINARSKTAYGGTKVVNDLQATLGERLARWAGNTGLEGFLFQGRPTEPLRGYPRYPELLRLFAGGIDGLSALADLVCLGRFALTYIPARHKVQTG